MKKLFIFLLMCMPMAALAQNNWELNDEPKPEPVKVNPDEKYLTGAVPEVDGKVAFHTAISAPGKSADVIYSTLLNYIDRMTKADNQIENSRVVLNDPAKHEIAAYFQEWLIFTSNAITLDRTRFRFTLIVNCQDGSADVTMKRISYLYEEERKPQNLKAEDWITDKVAVNKKGTKLYPITAKFRRKTIDRKDFIFNKFEELLK